ncbi:MAG: hypothetical protein BWX45_00909 [Deltaproteobacteria bacterium ADurb.Bin002]|nr:MAG: hypothetical protein BWX45_00909 [Deltaproteobacteria bacterium ADurb.Bin002]
MTSSPSSKSACARLYSVCLAPQETTTCDRLYSRRLSVFSLAMIASLSSSVPPTGVYFVKPASMARMAACLMWSGVSKSGSPAPKPMTSLPCARRALALAVMARVSDGFTFATLDASFTNDLLLFFYWDIFRAVFDTHCPEPAPGPSLRGSPLP